MKNRKKTLILLVAVGLILLMMIGGIVARERFQTCTVYNFPARNVAHFQVTEHDESWNRSIVKHAAGLALCLVYDEDEGHIVIEKWSETTTGGFLSLKYNHHYRLEAYPGYHEPPGNATVNVNSNDYQSSSPIGP